MSRWDFMNEPWPLWISRTFEEAQPEDTKGVARQNGILRDLFDEMEAEQERIDLLEAAVEAAHHARERARRNGKGRSRASQQRRAAHARMAEWCEPCRATRAAPPPPAGWGGATFTGTWTTGNTSGSF